jgi:hypothetical protein
MMSNKQSSNPFNITKADDFNDNEIQEYWVDMSMGGFAGFAQLIKPTSPMPMMILGGKGSGKTHLMRYYSFQLQKIRNSPSVLEGLSREGYMGIYLRCGDLDATRFQGKKQESEKWATVFSYYMELWFAQSLLFNIIEACKDNIDLHEYEPSICNDIVGLFTHYDFSTPNSLMELIDQILMMQKEVDKEVNDCGYTYKLNIMPCIKLGALTLGIPEILAKHLPIYKNVLILYLIDEYDLLKAEHQKYFNTLIRVKRKQSSFKIAARLYGIMTYATYNDREVNKHGAEYEVLFLDSQLRGNSKSYNKFIKDLCINRLLKNGFFNGLDKKAYQRALSSAFISYSNKSFHKEETAAIINKYLGKERPYFNKLRNKLQLCATKYGLSEAAIDFIIKSLVVSEYPLLEKANIFLLYRDMFAGKHPYKSASIISKECLEYLTGKGIYGRYSKILSYFKKDLMAQLLNDCREKQRYLGIDTFISMSFGIPRNFLIILKNIFRWSVFNDEKPFSFRGISISSQRKGVLESAEWFLEDEIKSGEEGNKIRQGVDNLANLFRMVRFSDKPSECSLCTFSSNLIKASETANHIINGASNLSLLVNIAGGQRHKNKRRVDSKYQINTMIAPIWDLPIHRRGTIGLNSDEVNAIFDQSHYEHLDELIDNIIQRMTAPFFGKKHNKSMKLNGIAKSLWSTND